MVVVEELYDKIALVGRSSLLSLDQALASGFDVGWWPAEPDYYDEDPL